MQQEDMLCSRIGSIEACALFQSESAVGCIACDLARGVKSLLFACDLPTAFPENRFLIKWRSGRTKRPIGSPIF